MRLTRSHSTITCSVTVLYVGGTHSLLHDSGQVQTCLETVL